MITVEEHLAAVLADARPLAAARVQVEEANGRVLAVDALALSPSPPVDNSAMDGYAVRCRDARSASPTLPVVLRVVGEVAAGCDDDPAIGAGEAVRIMTGAPVPLDADSVVPIERTLEQAWSADHVRLTEPPTVGANIRRGGEDVRVGELVSRAGTVLGARDIAGIVASGLAEVDVSPRPRVAIVTTGDELTPPGAPLRRGAVYDSNGPLLAALMADAGCLVLHRARAGDALGELEAVLDEVLQASVDVVVLTGGVSVGAHDPVTRLDLGFAKVAMQPGKPQAFGRLGDTAVFGLPGNPVSVAVSFEVFVRPFLRTLQGLPSLASVEECVAEAAWRTPPDRRQYLPAKARWKDGVLYVRPATERGGGSHLIGRLGRADGYVVVPADVAEVRVGDRLTVMLNR